MGVLNTIKKSFFDIMMTRQVSCDTGMSDLFKREIDGDVLFEKQRYFVHLYLCEADFSIDGTQSEIRKFWSVFWGADAQTEKFKLQYVYTDAAMSPQNRSVEIMNVYRDELRHFKNSLAEILVVKKEDLVWLLQLNINMVPVILDIWDEQVARYPELSNMLDPDNKVRISRYKWGLIQHAVEDIYGVKVKHVDTLYPNILTNTMIRQPTTEFKFAIGMAISMHLEADLKKYSTGGFTIWDLIHLRQNTLNM